MPKSIVILRLVELDDQLECRSKKTLDKEIAQNEYGKVKYKKYIITFICLTKKFPIT